MHLFALYFDGVVDGRSRWPTVATMLFVASDLSFKHRFDNGLCTHNPQFTRYGLNLGTKLLVGEDVVQRHFNRLVPKYLHEKPWGLRQS
ncbi:hypothetical protein PTBPS01_19600 [Burkholderia pseudomallei]|nr:hypothetical protein PTBPS01_19600 [Burkholderia pseudomallei]ONA33120.1 hypothetical protein AQ878_21215 [Burkholderia pseudomallei]